MKKTVVKYAVVIALFTFGGTRAHASCSTWVPISSCGQSCYTNCFLSQDLSCTSGFGIRLLSGAKLDMCGRAMHCVGAQCTAAVQMLGSTNGSQVINSSLSIAAVIDGPWFEGVDCTAHLSTKVIGVHFQRSGPGAGYFDVRDCSKVEQNVFVSEKGGVVVDFGTANSDEIDNNYFSGVGEGVFLSSDSFKFTIDHNLFAGSSVNYQGYTNSFTISNNIFLGSNAPLADGGGTGVGAYSTNYCDPESSACTTCVSTGRCSVPEAPFSLP